MPPLLTKWKTEEELAVIGGSLTAEDWTTFSEPLTPLVDRLAFLLRIAAKYQKNTAVRFVMAGLTQSGKTSFTNVARGGDIVESHHEEHRTQGLSVSVVDFPVTRKPTPFPKYRTCLFDFGGEWG